MDNFQTINQDDKGEPTARNKINNNFAEVENLMKEGFLNPGWTGATYVSATSFKVAGDVTDLAKRGKRLRITFETAGAKVCTIQSATYDSGNGETTITVSGESLVNEAIISVEIDLSPAVDQTKTQLVSKDPTNPQDVATKNYVDISDKNSAIPGCRVRLSADQTIPHNTETKINFDVKDYDALNEWDTTNKKFVCTKPGRYAIYLQTWIEEPDEISNYCIIKKNGSEIAKGQIRGGGTWRISSVYTVEQLAVDDYIEFFVFSYNYTDGGDVILKAYASRTFATINKIA